VIVAISLEPHEVVQIERIAGHPREVRERRFMTDDPSWLNGPPFAVAEHIFDEYSMEGCSLTPAADAQKGNGG